MAPSSIFSRLTTLKVGGANANTPSTNSPPDTSSGSSRRSRSGSTSVPHLATSATFPNLPPSRPPTDGSSRGPIRGTTFGAGIAATPKLVLTSDSNERLERHGSSPSSPGSLHRPSSLIMDPAQVLTMSPEESRSSAEEYKPKRQGAPPPPLSLGQQSAKTEEGARTAVPLLQPAFELAAQTTPKSTGNSLPKMEGNTSRKNSVASSTGVIDLSSPKPHGLKGRSSKSSIRTGTGAIAMSDSPTVTVHPAPQGGQHLTLPSDGDGMSDGASVVSSSGKKKQPWRKASTSSFKPSKSGSTGSALGAALAQTGLSMAHPAAVATSPTRSIAPPNRTNTRLSAPLLNNNSSSRLGSRLTSGSEDSDSDGAYDSDSQSGLSFTDDAVPVTGFAVASSKRNADFHDLFPDVPEGDYLIEDYGCALQREILIQGRLYISESSMCFHANIFGWVTNLNIPFSGVTNVEKKMTAFVIPNAIMVSTSDAKYTFASFISRDTTFDVITNIWRLAHPGGIASPSQASKSDAGSTYDTAPGRNGSEFDAASPLRQTKAPNGTVAPPGLGAIGSPGGKKAHKATMCACSIKKQHYPELAMECVFPGTPEKIYNLIFASGFIKDFMITNQKLTDIQISDWCPTHEGSPLLARNMSYIKPLNGSIGPKSTKCQLKDETVHVDFDDWVGMLTTTTTPDVPSGSVFAIKTRTCITWANSSSAKVVVTTVVEWSGRSFIKGIIERSALEGQRTYHADLEKAMRAYIAEHLTEFLPEGATESTAIALEQAAAEAAAEAQMLMSPTGDQFNIQHPSDVEQRGMQWALDTANGTLKVAKESFTEAIEILRDIWKNHGPWAIKPQEEGAASASGAAGAPGANVSYAWVAYAVIGFLVFTNLWSIVSLRDARSRNEMTRQRMLREFGYDPSNPTTKSQKPVPYQADADQATVMANVATDAVKAFWEGMVDRHKLGWSDPAHLEELRAMQQTVAALEARLDALERKSTDTAALD